MCFGKSECVQCTCGGDVYFDRTAAIPNIARVSTSLPLYRFSAGVGVGTGTGVCGTALGSCEGVDVATGVDRGCGSGARDFAHTRGAGGADGGGGSGGGGGTGGGGLGGGTGGGLGGVNGGGEGGGGEGGGGRKEGCFCVGRMVKKQETLFG